MCSCKNIAGTVPATTKENIMSTLDTLFDDIDTHMSTPTQSKLVWINEVDEQGTPIGYGLSGDIIDHDGAVFSVGEYTPNFDRAWNTLLYYVHNFDNVTVTFEYKTFSL